MNLPEHLSLWNNIQQFVLDEPNTTITFSKKLARQQNWSPAYTERVIEEYRKFIFLCCISPKGASPSKPVDEAWHLHLTYTQSYWNEFCKKTLGKELHHYPSSGGSQEDHKHATWYGDTLNVYEEVFGEQPPPDIWPQPVKQLQPAEQSWTVLEQPYRIGKELMIIVALLLLLPFVINYFLTGLAFPFDLKGPQFLLFFAILGVTSLIAHSLLLRDKSMSIKKLVEGWSMGEMTIFQLTHIVYGKERALQTCLVDLYRRNLVSVNDDGKIVVHPGRYQAPAKEENPLIPALLIMADGSSVDYDTITIDWYKKQSFEHASTEKLFRLIDQKKSYFKKNLAIIIVIFIGLARMLQGVINDRPVGFLALEIIAVIVVAGIISYIFSSNNLLNNKLRGLMLDKAGSKQLHADEVINDYALNGPRVLDWLPANLMLGAMFAVFPVASIASASMSDLGSDNNNSSWGADSSGSSCSGGDSSGGSGGGCGGCGGSSD
jgi:hypothetical protein